MSLYTKFGYDMLKSCLEQAYFLFGNFDQYHPTADTNGRSRVVGVPVYADWNAPFLFFFAFLAELY